MKKFYNENAVAITVFILMCVLTILAKSLSYNFGIRSPISEKENLYYIEFYNTILSGISFIFSVIVSIFVYLNYKQTKREIDILEINQYQEYRPWIDFNISSHPYEFSNDTLIFDLTLEVENIGKGPALEIRVFSKFYPSIDDPNQVFSNIFNNSEYLDAISPTLLMNRSDKVPHRICIPIASRYISEHEIPLNIAIALQYKSNNSQIYYSIKSFFYHSTLGQIYPQFSNLNGGSDAFGQPLETLKISESQTRKIYK